MTQYHQRHCEERLRRSNPFFSFFARRNGLLRCCSVRGHSLHLFGDMVDTFWMTQINRRDLVRGEVNSEPPICIEWTNGKPLATKGLRDLPQSALEADIVLGSGDGTDGVVLVVIHGWPAVRH